MVSPIVPTGQIPVTMPADTFTGQKLERGQSETPRMVVGNKENVSSAKEEVPREEVEKAADKLNRLMGLMDKRMKFEVHERSNRVMVKIIDEKSGDVINEIPSEKILDIMASLQEFVGILVDEKV